MILDVANPSILDSVDGENIVFIIAGIIILLSIFGAFIYLKIKKRRRIKNEKD